MGNIAFTCLPKKHPIETLSTREAEYVAAAEINNFTQYAATSNLDSMLAIEFAKNTVHYERNKYIDLIFHFIRKHARRREYRIYTC